MTALFLLDVFRLMSAYLYVVVLAAACNHYAKDFT